MEDEKEQEVETIYVERAPAEKGPLPGLMVVMVMALLSLAMLTIYFAREAANPPLSGQCVIQNDTMKAQAAASMDSQKRLQELQFRSMEDCSKSGGVPLFLQGNISCQMLKKGDK